MANLLDVAKYCAKVRHPILDSILNKKELNIELFLLLRIEANQIRHVSCFGYLESPATSFTLPSVTTIANAICFAVPTVFPPVSYTHLDVYKRQDPYSKTGTSIV